MLKVLKKGGGKGKTKRKDTPRHLEARRSFEDAGGREPMFRIQSVRMLRCCRQSSMQKRTSPMRQMFRKLSNQPAWESVTIRLHHRRPQTVAQISHEILETSPEHGHTRPAGKQDGTKDRRQAGLGDEPRRRTQHPRPDGRQAGRQDQRQEKDKPRGADTASQMKDKLRDKTKTKAGETRRETRERQDQGQSIPDQMGDKLGDKTGDGPARRTQHPSQDGRQDRGQDRRQEKDKTSQADTASQTRWETRWETRPEASPAKRTQHPSQGGHTKKALRTPTVNCLGEKSHEGPRARSQ